MKRFFLLTTLLLAGALAFMLHRLGGWRYAWYRMEHTEAGLYNHRKQHFAQLPERSGAIIFLGDSQIAQAEWHELLQDSIPVLNRGISGDHVNGVFARLDEVLRHNPLKIYLLVGINDLISGKSPADIQARYRDIVQRVRHDQPDIQLILLSVLPVNNTIKHIGIENEAIQVLNSSIAQIARDYALTYLDLYSQLTDASGNLSPKFSEDGIHLNGDGYQVFRQTVQKK